MKLRRYLVAGILVWLPLGVTFFLLSFLIGLTDKTLNLLPARYRPDQWSLPEWVPEWLANVLPDAIPGVGVVLTIIVLLLTGLLAANIVGRSVVGGWEALLDRIPIVRSIYSASKNFTEIVFSDSGKAFKKVLLVEYPRKGIYTITFQTATDIDEIEARTGEDIIACFVPTTPNPTSGFIIVVPSRDVIELDMEVDEAVRLIMSLGVVIPTWSKAQTAELPLKMPAGD